MGNRRAGALLAFVVAVATMAACGDPDALSNGGAGSTAVVPDATTRPGPVPVGPATTLPDPSPATAPLAPSRPPDAPAEAGESWCPAFEPATAPIIDADFTAAERTLGIVNAYTVDHVDEAGEAWMDSSVTPPVVVIGFTAHVAMHRAALAAPVAAGTLVVCQVRHGRAELETVNQQLTTEFQADTTQAVASWGRGVDAVTVGLRADQEALAADLVRRYGDAVTVTVGLFPYPMPAAWRAPALSACSVRDLTGPRSWNGLVATAVLAQPAVVSGHEGQGTVTITNTGAVPVEFSSGEPLTGAVVRPGTTTVVGVSVFGVAGVGAGGVLQPGEGHQLRLSFGTASCEPALGYALPPGTYEVLVSVPVSTYQVTPPVQLVTAPVALTVTG